MTSAETRHFATTAAGTESASGVIANFSGAAGRHRHRLAVPFGRLLDETSWVETWPAIHEIREIPETHVTHVTFAIHGTEMHR